MKSKKLYWFVFFVLSFCVINAQEKNNFHSEITTWYQNKAGAISLSFDDAGYTQFEFAYPILERNNIKGTFSIVGEWIHDEPTYSAEQGNFEIRKMGWNEIKKLSNSGHEISAHGYKHEKYSRQLPRNKLVEQMIIIKKFIETNINSPIYTLHYPYSYTSNTTVAASKEAGFLFCRTAGDSINEASPNDMNFLVSKTIFNNNTPDTNQVKQWVHQAQGKWLIIMYHHLFPLHSKEDNLLNFHKVTNTYSLYPETFDIHVRIISRSNYWAAPISTIGKFITERDNIELTMDNFKNTLSITTTTELDTSIYNQPITIKVNLPWKKVSVEGSEKDGNYKVTNSEIFVDCLPGKTILIKKSK